MLTPRRVKTNTAKRMGEQYRQGREEDLFYRLQETPYVTHLVMKNNVRYFGNNYCLFRYWTVRITANGY